MSTSITPLMAPNLDRLNDVVQDNVLAQMGRRRLSGRRAAAMLGMSQQAMSDRLRGRTRISLDDVEAFAALFGLEPMDLLHRTVEWAPRGSNPQPAD